MITRRTVYPGDPGSKKWQKLYGDKLLCVRYKYDEQTNKRITTIELIADEQDWQPNTTVIPRNKIVHLRINYGEVELARKVRSMGGKWNKENGLGTCLWLCSSLRIGKTCCGLKK